jgi:choline-sulfatase
MPPQNTLILMSDEHNRAALGGYGNPVAATPKLDALAAKGTRFEAAYTNCPFCVPARASFATGRYVHQIGFWDNADPYDGSTDSWHHILRRSGHRAVSIGKLHFRSNEDD